MGERFGIRERKERFKKRLIEKGNIPPDKAERMARDTVRRLEVDGRIDGVVRKEQRQR